MKITILCLLLISNLCYGRDDSSLACKYKFSEYVYINSNDEDYNRSMLKIKNELSQKIDDECKDVANNIADISKFIEKISTFCVTSRCPANFTAAKQKELQLDCLAECSSAAHTSTRNIMAYFDGLRDGQNSCPEVATRRGTRQREARPRTEP